MCPLSHFNLKPSLGQNPLLVGLGSTNWEWCEVSGPICSTPTKWPCCMAGCFLSLSLPFLSLSLSHSLSLSLSGFSVKLPCLISRSDIVKDIMVLFCFFDMFSKLECNSFNIVFPASCVCLSFSYTCAHISVKCQLLAIFYLSVCNQS